MSCYLLILINFVLLLHSGVSQNHSLEGRIVKGFRVKIASYPYAVFLYFKNTIPRACGATLIMGQVIITAAHCFDELKYNDGKITAYLGATIPIDAKVIRKVEKYRIHPKYDPGKGKFNLGLGLLSTPVRLSHGIMKIDISTVFPTLDDQLFTCGWGKQMHNTHSDYSDRRHLKASTQRLLSRRQCATFSTHLMANAFWCTVAVNGYHYHGDAGNGLINHNSSLIGVVSYMINDATIYTNVIPEVPWISDSILKLTDEGCP